MRLGRGLAAPVLALVEGPAPMRPVPLVLLLCCLTGCRTGPSAAERYVQPGDWSGRVPWAVTRAATDPHTWVPAALAGALSLGELDTDLSHWASRHTPVFGSTAGAARWSDRLRTANQVAVPLSIALRQRTSRAQALDGLYLAVVDAGAWASTDRVSAWLKDATRRGRPNGVNNRSMPSSHAAEAAALASVGRENLNWIHMPAYARRASKLALTSSAALTAWARIEAQEHYPSDAFAGLAIGNFIGRFLHETLVGSPRDPSLSIASFADGKGVGLQLGLRR